LIPVVVANVLWAGKTMQKKGFVYYEFVDFFTKAIQAECHAFEF